MDEILRVAKKIKELEECGEIRLVYRDDIGANAFVMSNLDKYVIVVNSSLSYEQQIKEIWHEAKHICSHLNTDYSLNEAEAEADSFADRAINFVRSHNYEF